MEITAIFPGTMSRISIAELTLGEVDFADIFQIAIGMLVVILLTIGGMYLARRIRSWTRGEQPREGFSLHGLREMRRTGEITEEEFAELRKRIIRTVVAVPAPPESSVEQADAEDEVDDIDDGDSGEELPPDGPLR
jgi:uncharacterized membrane protein